MLRLPLDRTSPTPLYHQIVQAIRWRIGTGALSAGASLPSIRKAAEDWGVNYHTVRRAYQELALEGWVESARGEGTWVAFARSHDADEESDEVGDWLDQIITLSRERYGLSVRSLAQLIRERAEVSRVVMVECSEHQSGYLARQLERSLSLEAIPWSLSSPDEPPHLPLVGTYFHHTEMRACWPERTKDMHFVALELDRALHEQVEAVAARRSVRSIRLVEQEMGTAQSMAASVSALLSPQYEASPVVGDPAELLESLPGDELILVAPGLWDAVPVAVRDDERVLGVRYVIIAEDLQRLRRSLTQPEPRRLAETTRS